MNEEHDGLDAPARPRKDFRPRAAQISAPASFSRPRRRRCRARRTCRFALQTPTPLGYTLAVLQTNSTDNSETTHRMTKLKIVLCLAACALLVAACTSAPESNQTAGANSARPAGAPTATPTAARPAPSADELAAIRGVYAKECQRCHKPDGAGGTFEEEGLKPLKVPGLRSGDAARHTDEQLARKITNGDVDEGMPAFKSKLTPEQINELVRFIRVEFQGRAGAGAANTSAPGNANSPVSAH
jgi:mono/diheme cytochrome c family protein